MLQDRQRSTTTRSVVGYATSAYAGLAGGFLTNVILARGLDVDGRGRLAVALHVGYLLATLAAGGMERTLGSIGEVTPFPQALALGAKLSRRRVAVSVVIALASAPLWPGPQSGLVTALLVATIGVGSGALTCVRAAALTSARTARFGLVNSTVQLMTILLFVIGATVGRFSWQHYLACFAVTQGALAVYVYAGQGQFSSGSSVDSGSVVPPVALVRSARRYAVGLLSSKLSMRADRFLIPVLVSPAELGAYVVPAAFAELMVLGVSAVSEGLIPSIANQPDSTVRRSVVPVIGMIMAVAVVAGLASFCALRLVIGPIFGSAYAPGSTLSLALATGTCFLSASQLAGNVLAAKCESKVVSRVEVGGAVLALGGYLLLIPGSGALGAAVAATFAYGAMANVQLIALYRQR